MAKISLLSHQIDTIVMDFIETVVKQQKQVSLFSINALRQQITEQAKDSYLLFPANTWDIKSPINVQAHNDNVVYIKKDIDSFNKTILDIVNQVTRIKRNIDITRRYYGKLTETVNTAINSIYSSVLSNELTFIERFVDTSNINTTLTTALVDTNLQIAEVTSTSATDMIRTEEIVGSAILVKPSSDNLQSFNYTGERTSIFSSDATQTLQISAITNVKETVTASITIPLSPDRTPKNANSISVKVSNPNGMFARIFVSADGINYVPTTVDIIAPLNGVFQVKHDKGLVITVRIDLIKSNEDSITSKFLKYNFIIEQVSFDTKIYNTSAVIVSNSITKMLDNKPISIGSVKMEVDDYTPGSSSIIYEVSLDGNAWRPIVPINKADAPNNQVNFKTAAQYLTNGVKPLNNSIWGDIKPVESKGNAALYNILFSGLDTTGKKNFDFCKNITNTDTGKTSNVITVVGSTIIQESVTMRRGYGDWAAVSANAGIDSTVRRIDLKFRTADNFKTAIPLQIVEERQKSDITGLITTKYPILEHMNVIVTKDGKQLAITSVTNTGIEISALANQSVLVTYFTAISDYETISGWDVTLKNDSIVVLDPITEVPVSINNFEIDQFGMTIKIRSGAKLTTDSLNSEEVNLKISYDFTIKKNSTALIYQTFVTVSQPTTLKIFPFTSEEVTEYGNFHTIDGIDVSFNTTYILQAGSHQIVSTNPHKTNPNNANDVNLLSLKPSKAGILLRPEYVKEMYGYQLPQRRVSAFNLANTVKIGDDRSFAVNKVGSGMEVLLNRIPEEIPSKLLSAPTTDHRRGTKLFCKRAVYTSNGDFNYYESVPETFTITFNVLVDSATPIDHIFYRATLKRSATNAMQTPFINTIKIQFALG